MIFQAIVGFRLVTDDPARLVAFYRAIGFDVGEAAPIPVAEMKLLGLCRRRFAHFNVARRKPRRSRKFRPAGSRLSAATRGPAISSSSTSRSSRTMRRPHGAARAKPAPRRSAESGPVTLPKSAGGVTAVKFRDPEGHPLEFLQFPRGANPDWKGTGVMGIDHSAVSVSDVAASRRFYARHGLSEAARPSITARRRMRSMTSMTSRWMSCR